MGGKTRNWLPGDRQGGLSVSSGLRWKLADFEQPVPFSGKAEADLGGFGLKKVQVGEKGGWACG